MQEEYTKEQYERCLKAATVMANAIRKIEQSPITPESLQELLNSGNEYSQVMAQVVNENAGYAGKQVIRDAETESAVYRCPECGYELGKYNRYFHNCPECGQKLFY